jgi:hypothetical protein
MQNYQRMVSLNQHLLRQASLTTDDESRGGGGSIPLMFGCLSQEVVLAGFVIVILTLFMMTMAMYKLGATLAAMEERVFRLETTVDRNRGVYDLLLQQNQEL